MDVSYIAGYIATGEQIEPGDKIVSNISGRTFTFIRVVAPNKIEAEDTSGNIRTFYASYVFGIETRAIKN